MINIIKRGNSGKLSDFEPVPATCSECKCEFTFTREDCWWSRPLLTYIIRCPECGEEIHLGDIYK